MDASKPSFALLRRLLPWVSLLVLAAVVYDGIVFYSRYSRERDVERAQAGAAAARDRKTIEMLGGDQLRIMNFYASPGAVHAGSPAFATGSTAQRKFALSRRWSSYGHRSVTASK